MKKYAVLIMVLVLTLTISCGKKEQPAHFAFFSFFLGDVFANGIQVQIGTLLHEKDVIKTDIGSFCDISMGESFIRIKENTEIVASQLCKDSEGFEQVELDMNIGKMLCKPKKLLKSENFTVKTPTAVAGIRGTVFSVEADPNKTTRIRVFEGKVKASKRVKQFDNYTEKLIDVGSLIEEDKKIVITEADIKKSEQQIEQFLKAKNITDEQDAAILDAIEQQQSVVKVDENIKKFTTDDYIKDDTDFIKIDTEPDRKKVIQKKRKKPVEKKKTITKEEDNFINARLFVTRYEVYFIDKDGQIEWEGRLAGDPVRAGERLYVLSEENIFCAKEDGRVHWRKKIPGSSRITLKDNKLIVFTGSGKNDYLELFADSGRETENP